VCRRLDYETKRGKIVTMFPKRGKYLTLAKNVGVFSFRCSVLSNYCSGVCWLMVGALRVPDNGDGTNLAGIKKLVLFSCVELVLVFIINQHEHVRVM